MVGLTLAGLLGTSSPNLYSGYQVRKQVADEPLQREIVADVVKAVAERNGLVCHDCRRRTQTAFYVGKVDLSYEFVSDTAVDFSMRWHPTGLFISGGESELAERIRGELKRTLGERLNGLEYVESLDANQRGLRMIRPAAPQPAGAGSAPAGKAPPSAASAPVRR
jgi:asparagine synthetase B (glutamine-hydrolysing)